MYIYLAEFLKQNSNHEKNPIVLMIAHGKKWHYLEGKNLFALLGEIVSKYNGDFYCLNCLPLSKTKTKLVLIKKYIKTKVFAVV